MTVWPVLFRFCQITSTRTNQWADQVTRWQSWMPFPGIFSCVHPGTIIPSTTRDRGFWMPSTNCHLPSAPLPCVQARLCRTCQMLNKDHDTTTAATQLICIVLANYGNICKKAFTAQGWHIMQCYKKNGGYSFAWFVLFRMVGREFSEFCSRCLDAGSRIGHVGQNRKHANEVSDLKLNGRKQIISLPTCILIQKVQPCGGAKIWAGSHLKKDTPSISESCVDFTFFVLQYKSMCLAQRWSPMC